MILLLSLFYVLISGKSTPADLTFWDSSRLPTVRITCSSEEWANLLRDFDANPLSEIYRHCGSFRYQWDDENVQIQNVGFRVKGSKLARVRPETLSNNTNDTTGNNSSLLYRTQFVVKFDESFNDDESVYGSADIPEMPANKGRTLLGNQKLAFRYGNGDPSLVQSVLVSDIRSEFKTRAARYAFARLYIIIGQDERYWGLYQMEETVDESFLEKREISTKRVFLYKCGWNVEQAKLQISHATPNPKLYIGKEKADPADANDWQTNKFKAFYPIYDLKEGDLQAGITKLAELIYYINISLSSQPKPPLAEIRAKFKITNILKGLALDAYLIDYDSTWFSGNNYYLYSKDDEWDIFRYDYDASLTNTSTIDLMLTDDAPLHAVCPLQGNGNYTFKLNASSLTFTLAPIKNLGLQTPFPSSSLTMPMLVGQNGTNVPLQMENGLWTARFNMSECYYVRLTDDNNTQLGLKSNSGLLSVPFLKFNQANFNAPYTPHSLVDLLMSYPALKQEYVGHVYELSRTLLTPTSVNARIQRYLDLIREAASPSLLQVQSSPSLAFSENVSAVSSILEQRRNVIVAERPKFKPSPASSKGK